MEFNFAGQSAVVTGGSRGIGQALAVGLATAGATIILWVEPGEEERAQVTRDLVMACDRTCLLDVVDMHERGDIKKAFVRLDAQALEPSIWINNAGVILRQAPEQVDLSDWNRVNGINLSNVFLLCREASRRMIPVGAGTILNIASVLSFGGGGTVPTYAISKGGLRSLTQSLATAWARYGIRVNALAPGHTRTALTEPTWRDPPSRRALDQRIPITRWGEPGDLVGAALFLCSDAARYVTGHLLAVDGGWLAN